MIEGRRLGIKTQQGIVLYYDLDADGRVYWLRQRPGSPHHQRYRVQDPELIQTIKQLANNHKEKQDGLLDSAE